MPIRLTSPDAGPSRSRSSSISSIDTSLPFRLLPDKRPRPQQRLSAKLKAFSKSPAGIVSILKLVSWLTGYLTCRQLFWRDPQSWFYNPSTVYDLDYSHTRQSAAREFIDLTEHTWKNQTFYTSGSKQAPVIYVGMVTVKRKHVQYLNDTIGSMLVGLTNEERSAIYVQLLFADPSPGIHPDWDKPWLSLLDYWSGYDVPEERREELRQLKHDQQIQKKATLYVLVSSDETLTTSLIPLQRLHLHS